MATLESMAIRSDAACKRIEQKLAELGVQVTPIPRLMRDREMLRAVQLEQIAALLEQVKLPKSVAVKKVTTKRNPVAAKGKRS